MKKPTGTWTKVRRGYWTWLDYEVTLRWVYEQYHERTHYWAWYVTVAGVELPTKHAIARQAKVAAEEHYARHRVR